jgi:carboxypeptidase Taq
MTVLTDLRDYVKEIAEINSATNLTIWDQRTHMPPKGADARAQVMARLERLSFDRIVSHRLGELLDAAEKESSSASDVEKGMVRFWRREYARKGAIPGGEYQRFVEACARGEHAWQAARAANDFGILAPFLEKTVAHVRRIAEHIGYDESPYDVPLDGLAIRLAGHPGMTIAKLRGVMAPLRKGLVKLLAKIRSAEEPLMSLPEGSFDVAKQRKLCRRALEAIGYDFEMGALDDTLHPFSNPVAPGDTRVTTRYRESDPFDGLFSALHEGGHALYMQGHGDALAWTGLDDAPSSGFHESQSRLWENRIGRSLEFWHYFLPIMTEYFPQLSDCAPEAVWRAVNRVSPGYIRVGADEVTYNLHVMLRIELEVALIEGTIEVVDLPNRWNEVMERDLGLVPPDDVRGVLQDVHWSAGKIGVFPAYLLGNLYGAQIMDTVEAEIPDLWKNIQQGEFSILLDWLRENIYRRGKILAPDELLKEVTGSSLTSGPFLNYLKRKFTQVYRLA